MRDTTVRQSQSPAALSSLTLPINYVAAHYSKRSFFPSLTVFESDQRCAKELSHLPELPNAHGLRSAILKLQRP